jgi:hypothetical protein
LDSLTNWFQFSQKQLKNWFKVCFWKQMSSLMNQFKTKTSFWETNSPLDYLKFLRVNMVKTVRSILMKRISVHLFQIETCIDIQDHIFQKNVIFVNFVKLLLKMSYIFYMIALSWLCRYVRKILHVYNSNDDTNITCIKGIQYRKTLWNRARPVNVDHAKTCEFLHECF